MAQNYIQPGNVIPIVAPAGGYVTEQVVKSGSIVGIALGSAPQDSICEVALEGVWQVAKATGAAWVPGDKLYWDAAALNFTKTATSNTAAGYAFASAATGDTTGQILLRQIA
ncbi:DUF2190 family protein [Chitinophaga sp. CF418]|uniref:DUF2190 family protein n=1 Tax=Chitinophaga sp. CF418 TaxID=1855287 RepID=UPI000913C9D8|nr:DUF2190 family protein [Chitinophaga sp. CF418]SHN45923.1 Predicted phage recombinase, RecA/RadA family [Chitinophaga sp. CF418]